MNVSIRVFPKPEDAVQQAFTADWVEALESRKYAVMADFMHRKDLNWFQNEVAGVPFMFSRTPDDLSRITLAQVEDWGVEIMICFDEDVELTPEQVQIVEKVFTGLGGDIPEDVWLAFEEFVAKPVWITGEIPNSKDSGDEPNTCDHYQFRQFHCVEQDCLIAEVKKPHVDRAYVTLIRDYSSKGERDLFCNFYACPSWGVADGDNIFMQKLWESKGMDGVYDCNAEVKSKIDKVEAGLEPEPKVWRSTLEKVLEIVTNVGYKGLGKRSGNENLDDVKRRV